MKYIISLVIALLFISPSYSDMNLVDQAREIEKANWRLVPGETVHKLRIVINRTEEIVFDSQVRLSHKLNDEGDIVNEVIEKDVDEKESRIGRERLKKILERDMIPKKEGFFLTGDEDNPKIKPLSENSEIDGKTCSGFEFVYTTKREGDEMTFEGVLWIDVETGAPVYSSSKAVNTPMFVGDIKVEQFFSYNPQTGIGYLTKLKTVTDINIPLRNMTMEMTEKYFDYWEYKEETEK